MSAANLPAAEQRCLFGTAEDYCGKPATVHILIGDATPTMDCDLHAEWWAWREHEDAHPIGPACGLPGTTWSAAGCFVEGIGS